MTSTETRNQRKEALNNRFARMFKEQPVNGMKCFLLEDGQLFHVDTFMDKDCLVLEFAESAETAKQYEFEDGDRYYMEDMDEEQMYEAMLEELRM